MITILDNVISKEYQDYLENLLLNNSDMTWHLIRNLNEVKSNQNQIETPGLSIQAISDGQDHGALAFIFRSLAYSLGEKLDIKIKEIVNARTFLQLPGGDLSELSPKEFHVDYARPHKVLLYYVNDSDGPTVLLKERFPFSHNKISGMSVSYTHLTLPTTSRV